MTTSTTDREIHRTRAGIEIDASADTVYRALTHVADWPLLYPWIAHTEVIAQDGQDDEVKFWAVRPGPEGGLRVWTSRRTLDPVALRMDFAQQGSVGPIKELGGTWDFLPRPDGGCQVVSGHWFTTDADPQDTAGELDRHGGLQMRTLKSKTEQPGALTSDVLRVEDRTLVPGPVAEVHARLLAALPPHEGGEESAWFGSRDGVPTVQIEHGGHTLVQKPLTPPGPAELYRRRWRLTQAPDGVLVRADVLALASTGRDRVLALATTDVRSALALAGQR
ncbi:SRPBCC family protein [Streptomyces sp. NBC_00083]|uniref:SRPBCC family protein n=1 Tax=Streptomyces sp. NBC_00083 TaxID=2975647 RepID=UPI0022591035|nr:SRPBCC family protein [Streptomyces sp. NBC_00083]MCX5382521.1 SRPBCC family protein [Streptomyces sp. NBC_00083]